MDKKRREILQFLGLGAISVGITGCGSSLLEYESNESILNVFLLDDQKILPYGTHTVFLKFSKPIDEITLKNAIILSDYSGDLDISYTYEIYTKDPTRTTVRLLLNDGALFKEAWKYSIIIHPFIISEDGIALSEKTTLSFIIGSRSPFDVTSPVENILRNKVIFISDIHMGRQEAADEGYSIFTKNNTLFYTFLEKICSSPFVKELVILGDLMDNWIVPMTEHTFDDNIPDNKAYFKSIAEAEINKGIFEKLNQIANGGDIRLVYIPGNHDMLFSEEIFKELIPNGIWKGTNEGTGIYFLEDRIVCEHGHNYDAFNAPDMLTTPGSILPPGYFISRIYATSLISPDISTTCASLMNKEEDSLYQSVWNMAVKMLGIPASEWDKAQIVTGVDGYTDTYSINEARDIYTDSISENWILRQVRNGVFKPNENLNLVSMGVFDSGSLEKAVQREYFETDRADIVVLGHTHNAEILKDTSYSSAKIYANSGAWCESTKNNATLLERTCIVLDSSYTTGSEISMVTLYQYSEEQELNRIIEEYI